ncbi:MAG: 4Fe-4S binding protein [Clostridiales bacterium]|nr:4Fe-4S binding protein [Clostridiales bacterium]
MKALEYLNNKSSMDVQTQIELLGVQGYGLKKGSLKTQMEAAVAEGLEEEKETKVICALNNADVDGVFLALLKEAPEKVLDGIVIAARALDTEGKSLIIPEYTLSLTEDESLKSMAAERGITLETGIVDVRAAKGSLLLHIVTAYTLATALEGEEAINDSVYVSVNGEKPGFVAADTKVSEVADLTGAKAVQVGYRYELPDVVADLSLKEACADNGVIRVLTEKDCIVKETEKRLTIYRGQSCGKCVFCREGLTQLEYMQKETAEGRGKIEFLKLTKEIGEAMTFSTSCTLGENASLIALSAIKDCKDEYTAHIKKKKCPAGVCFSSEKIYIDPKVCTGCGECMEVCPKDCIEGRPKYIHMIDDLECDKCGKCMEVCDDGAIIKTEGKVPKLPKRLTKVGRFRR